MDTGASNTPAARLASISERLCTRTSSTRSAARSGTPRVRSPSSTTPGRLGEQCFSGITMIRRSTAPTAPRWQVGAACEPWKTVTSSPWLAALEELEVSDASSPQSGGQL